MSSNASTCRLELFNHARYSRRSRNDRSSATSRTNQVAACSLRIASMSVSLPRSMPCPQWLRLLEVLGLQLHAQRGVSTRQIPQHDAVGHPEPIGDLFVGQALIDVQ